MATGALGTTISFRVLTGRADFDCTVDFTVTSSSSRGSRHEPPSGAEFTVDGVYVDVIDDSVDFDSLDSLAQQQITEKVGAYIENDMSFEDDADRGDFLYEQQKDRNMDGVL